MRSAIVSFEESIAHTHPTLAASLAPCSRVDSSRIRFGTHEEFPWLCSEGHIFTLSPKRAATHSIPCRVCRGVELLIGYNDLATTDPLFAKAFHSSSLVQAEEITSSSSLSITLECTHCGAIKSQIARHAHRNFRLSGKARYLCQDCGRKKLHTTFAEAYPDLVRLFSPNSSVHPQMVSPGSKLKALVHCSICEKEFSKQVSSIPGSQMRCGDCWQRNRPLPGLDMETLRPDLAEYVSSKSKISPCEISPNGTTPVLFRCDSCKADFQRTPALFQVSKVCRTCSYSTSQGELDLVAYVRSLGVKVEQHRRDLLGSRQELDLHLPKFALAFEYNGDYWHSDKQIQANHKMPASTHHLSKMLKAKQNGILLCFVWEYDWKNNRAEIEAAVAKQIFKNTSDPLLLRLTTPDPYWA